MSRSPLSLHVLSFYLWSSFGYVGALRCSLEQTLAMGLLIFSVLREQQLVLFWWWGCFLVVVIISIIVSILHFHFYFLFFPFGSHLCERWNAKLERWMGRYEGHAWGSQGIPSLRPWPCKISGLTVYCYGPWKSCLQEHEGDVQNFCPWLLKFRKNSCRLFRCSKL